MKNGFTQLANKWQNEKLVCSVPKIEPHSNVSLQLTVQLSVALSCAWEPGKTVLVQLFKIYLYYSFSDKKEKKQQTSLQRTTRVSNICIYKL